MMINPNIPPAGVMDAVQRAITSDADATHYGFQVIPENTRIDGDWVYLVINPSKQNGLGAYQFASILGRIEEQVREALHSKPHVMLLPASGVVRS